MTQHNTMQKLALIKRHTQKRERTDRAWFSYLLWYPARKRSGAILTTP